MHQKCRDCMWCSCRVWSSGTILGDPDDNQSEPRLQRWRCWCATCFVVENHYCWSSSQQRRATLWCTSWSAMDFAVYEGKWICNPDIGRHYACVSWSNNRELCSLSGCQRRSCSCARLSFCCKDGSAALDILLIVDFWQENHGCCSLYILTVQFAITNANLKALEKVSNACCIHCIIAFHVDHGPVWFLCQVLSDSYSVSPCKCYCTPWWSWVLGQYLTIAIREPLPRILFIHTETSWLIGWCCMVIFPNYFHQ